MKTVRIIPRLDVKGSNVVKGMNLEGLRIIGDPQTLAERYYLDGADELLYMDIVASLYQRENLLDIVNKTSDNIFIPLTVGGGIRSLQNIKELLRAGADKVAINTMAIQDPKLLSEAANRFGSQCITLSIEAKKVGKNTWEAFTDNGREPTGKDVIEWAKKGIELGAGELLITSIDNEGTKKGLDCNLLKQLSKLSVPIIASGGIGCMEDILQGFECKMDAVALASTLHYMQFSIADVKEYLLDHNINVRPLEVLA